MIKYHYFLTDFCYYANVACFVQILALPGSPALFRSVFAYANGPILMAILPAQLAVVPPHDKAVGVHPLHPRHPDVVHAMAWQGGLDLLGLIGWRSSESSGTSRVRLSAETLGAPMPGMAMEFTRSPSRLSALANLLPPQDGLGTSSVWTRTQLVTSLRWLANDYKAPVTRWALRTSVVRPFRARRTLDASSLKTKFVFVSLQLIYTVITFLPIPLCYVSKAFHTSNARGVSELHLERRGVLHRHLLEEVREKGGGVARGSVRDEDEADALFANGRG